MTGASSGLGEPLAERFALDGHDLVLVARRRDRLLLRRLGCTARGIEAVPHQADLADPEAVPGVQRFLVGAGIDVEFLVNCAGFGSGGAFADLDVHRELAMIDVNTKALMHLTALVLPDMITRRSGRVLNIGSVVGFMPGPFVATYYASQDVRRALHRGPRA